MTLDEAKLLLIGVAKDSGMYPNGYYEANEMLINHGICPGCLDDPEGSHEVRMERVTPDDPVHPLMKCPRCTDSYVLTGSGPESTGVLMNGDMTGREHWTADDWHRHYLWLATQDCPKDVVCGWCGGPNDWADDCGFFYLSDPHDPPGGRKNVPACKACCHGKPGEQHYRYYGIGER